METKNRRRKSKKGDRLNQYEAAKSAFHIGTRFGDSVLDLRAC